MLPEAPGLSCALEPPPSAALWSLTARPPAPRPTPHPPQMRWWCSPRARTRPGITTTLWSAATTTSARPGCTCARGGTRSTPTPTACSRRCSAASRCGRRAAGGGMRCGRAAGSGRVLKSSLGPTAAVAGGQSRVAGGQGGPAEFYFEGGRELRPLLRCAALRCAGQHHRGGHPAVRAGHALAAAVRPRHGARAGPAAAAAAAAASTAAASAAAAGGGAAAAAAIAAASGAAAGSRSALRRLAAARSTDEQRAGGVP